MSDYTPYTAPSAYADRLRKIEILISNNSEQVTELLRSMLHEIGFRKMHIAHNSYETVQLLRKHDPKLLITDADLTITQSADGLVDDSVKASGLCGYEFVRRLRHSAKSPAPFIPIIMLAPEEDESADTFKARDAGVNELATHPLEAKKLFDKMMQIIDYPRIFVTASSYRGPCRRIEDRGAPDGQDERRKFSVQIIQYARLLGT